MSIEERRETERNWIQHLAGAKEFDGQRKLCTWVGLSMLAYAGVCKACSVLLFKITDQLAKELDKG